MLFDEHDSKYSLFSEYVKKNQQKIKGKKKIFFNVIILKIYGGMKK